jgi:hypothetical protein
MGDDLRPDLHHLLSRILDRDHCSNLAGLQYLPSARNSIDSPSIGPTRCFAARGSSSEETG